MLVQVDADNSIHAGSGRWIGKVLLSAFIIFLLLELSLQVRSHLRYGQSLFNVFKEETMYINDKITGLKLLRPNHVIIGSQAEIRTNSFGLRSPEISHHRVPNSLRIAIIGASTVMGAYAAHNDETFAALLEDRLRQNFPDSMIEVINAGIAGYTLQQQYQMLQHLILPLHPDLLIVYPGFNDFSGYCRDENTSNNSKNVAQRQGLPLISMPSWLLSVELVTKNTVFLRTTPSGSSSQIIDPKTINIKPYRTKLERIVKTALDAGLITLLCTNARAYRPEQSLEEQQRFSETARFYNPCFDINGLHKLYDLHNHEIENTGQALGIPVLNLGELVPGGSHYFSDASHFSKAGEQLTAEKIFEFLIKNGLVKL